MPALGHCSKWSGSTAVAQSSVEWTSVVLVKWCFTVLPVNVSYCSAQIAQRQRLNHCFAPGCTTGYSRIKEVPIRSLFKVPADPERKSVLEHNLYRSNSRTPDCAVCELHFQKCFIVKDCVHHTNGTGVRIPRETLTLTQDAVPNVLPNTAPYLNKRLPPERNERKRKLDDVVQRKKPRLTTAASLMWTSLTWMSRRKATQPL